MTHDLTPHIAATELVHEIGRHEFKHNSQGRVERSGTPIADLLHCEACEKVSSEFCEFIRQALTMDKETADA